MEHRGRSWEDLDRAVEHVTSHAIDLIEAAYDLEKSDSEWLSDLTDAAAPFLDHGLGIFAFNYVHPSLEGGGSDMGLHTPHLRSLPTDFLQRFADARSVIPPECFHAITTPGYAGTWTEASKDYPEISARFLETLGYPELFAIFASDPNGVGIFIGAPLPEKTKLTPKAQERWQMLGAHIASAFRLRQALSEAGEASEDHSTGLPRDAEAVIDVDGFRLVDSVGPANETSCAEVLREAARSVDRARSELRKDSPEHALETWNALVSGRWSMVDWFDTDGRRFVLAMPNAPECPDPRGLTQQECQVVMYILLGETSKLIAYRLGRSQARVSGLLKSAMHKLGVSSKLALVEKLGPLGNPTGLRDDGESVT